RSTIKALSAWSSGGSSSRRVMKLWRGGGPGPGPEAHTGPPPPPPPAGPPARRKTRPGGGGRLWPPAPAAGAGRGRPRAWGGGVPDLARRDHLQGAGLEGVDARHGPLAVEVAPERVEGAEEVLPAFQPPQRHVPVPAQVVQRLPGVAAADAERLVLQAGVVR